MCELISSGEGAHVDRTRRESRGLLHYGIHMGHPAPHENSRYSFCPGRGGSQSGPAVLTEHSCPVTGPTDSVRSQKDMGTQAISCTSRWSFPIAALGQNETVGILDQKLHTCHHFPWSCLPGCIHRVWGSSPCFPTNKLQRNSKWLPLIPSRQLSTRLAFPKSG